MWIILFIRDMLIYPFVSAQQKKMNRFHKLLTFVLKDYPAFFWRKPTLRRALSFPVLFLYFLFKN